MKKFKIPVKWNGENVEHYLCRMLYQAYPDWHDSEIGCMKEFIENNLIILTAPSDDPDEDYDNVMNLLAYWRKNKWRFDW